MKYEWDINNDGIYEYSSSSPTQGHIYVQQGTYIIKLRVTDNNGITRVTATTATISDTSPAADFTALPTIGNAPLTVSFTNNSAGYDQPLSYAWDFNNDGMNDSTDQSPSAIFTEAGTYSVKLTVTDSDGDGVGDACDFCAYLPVRIIGKNYYPTIQSAYDAAVAGDVIQSQSLFFSESFNADDINGKSVTMEGGYDCNYTSIIGKTKLIGQFRDSKGTVRIKNFVIKK